MNHLHRLLAVASAAFFIASSALAQNPGTVTNHAFALGKGPGTTGYTSLLCGSAQLAVGQAAADPVCRTITGDVTITAGGVTAIGTAKVTSAMLRDSGAISVIGRSANSTGVPADISATVDGHVLRRSASTLGFGTIDLSFANTVGSSILGAANGGTGISSLGTGIATFLGTPSSANLRAALTDEVGTGAAYFVGGALGTPASATLTNATGLPLGGLATQSAYTLVGNFTGSAASPTASALSSLTQKATPAGTDLILVQDQAASGQLKYATVASVGTSSGVSSIAGNTGAFTLGSGLTNSTNDLRVAAGVPLQTLQTVDTTNRTATTTSYTATGTISPSLTPASSSNKIRVQATGIVGASAGIGAFLTIFRSINGGAYTDLTPVGSTELQGFVISSNADTRSFVIDFLDSPATTNAVLYQIYMKNNTAGTVYLGRRGVDTLFNSPSIITVTEIKG